MCERVLFWLNRVQKLLGPEQLWGCGLISSVPAAFRADCTRHDCPHHTFRESRGYVHCLVRMEAGTGQLSSSLSQ